MAGQTIGKVVAGGKTHTITSTFYGTCATAAATAAKEVIINELNTTEALDFIIGMTLAVKFTYANGVANPTLTLFNNSGTAASPTKGSTTLLAAKPIMRYGTTAPSTSAATSWTAGAVVLFVYDGTNWIEASSWDNNSTYANYSFGNGYATCTTAAATAAKVATYTSYTLANHGVVAVKFTNAITVANPTLNINSKGAKAIWWHGAALTDTALIKAGDIVTFVYNTIDNSTGVYEILSISPITVGTTTVPNVTSVGSVPTLGTAIAADDITAWTTNTPTTVTSKEVVTGTTATILSVSDTTLILPSSVLTDKTTGDSVSVTAGTAASLSYTARSIPNVTSVGSAPTLGTAISVVNSIKS